MYTIKGLLDEAGSAAILASAKDWPEPRAKPAEFRKRGLAVEIWHKDGIKVLEPEIEVDAKRA